jgi:hypothetical protein
MTEAVKRNLPHVRRLAAELLHLPLKAAGVEEKRDLPSCPTF